MPVELLERPESPEEWARWVGPVESPPADWVFGRVRWVQIVAHRRWFDARRAWMAEHEGSPLCER